MTVNDPQLFPLTDGQILRGGIPFQQAIWS